MTRTHAFRTPALLGLLLCASPALAQQWVNPHYEPHRLDYKDIGYPTQNLVPADESQITALLTHSNGFVYGATSGRTQSYLFFHNRFINKVRPLGKIAKARGVYHTLIEGSDGAIYIGTGLNVLAPVELHGGFPVAIEAVEHHLWLDITAPYKGYEGGHIYRYDPVKGDVKTYTNDDQAPLEDLGIPGRRQHRLRDDLGSGAVGHLRPHVPRRALLRLRREDAARRKDSATSSARRCSPGPERHWRTVPRALHCDPKTGAVYSSGDNGWLVAIRPGHRRGLRRPTCGCPASTTSR